MKKILLFPVLTLLLLIVVPTEVNATDYYISANGNDTNTGTNQNSAWKTISKVNGFTFSPGDKILFEGGSTFNGNLLLNNASAGSATNPLTIASYGNGKAIIFAGSASGIQINDKSGIVVSNIRVSGGYDIATNSGNSGTGIRLGNSSGTQITFLRIDNVEVDHFRNEGIYVTGGNINDVRITNVSVHDNGLRGISTHGTNHTNLYIGYSKSFNNPGIPGTNSGDGIRVRGANGAVIEHNEVYNNCWLGSDGTGGGSGMWAYMSNNVIMQFNEAHHNYSPGLDGGGFDCDGGSTNCVIQYNYSHDNGGAGFLLAQYSGAATFSGNTIRYNISQNDGNGRTNGGILVWNGGTGITNTEIYNNTIYVSSATDHQANAIHIISGGISNLNIRNNILITHDTNNANGDDDVRLINSVTTSGVRFENNSYYDVSGKAFYINMGGMYTSLAAWRSASGQETVNGQPVGISGDPQLTSPGGGGTIRDTTKLTTLTAYQLKNTSALINKGLNLNSLFSIHVGTRDFFGNSIPHGSVFDIGAHEYNGNIESTPTSSLTPASSPTPTPQPTVKPGDGNNDGKVDEADYDIWLSHYTQTVSGGVTVGDFNSNGVVNGIDYTIWLNNFGT